MCDEKTAEFTWHELFTYISTSEGRQRPSITHKKSFLFMTAKNKESGDG